MTATIARTMDEHVVIVGAGPAGLAAAWAIRRAGQR
jgi:flavin-dependent dehydrogenase